MAGAQEGLNSQPRCQVFCESLRGVVCGAVLRTPHSLRSSSHTSRVPGLRKEPWQRLQPPDAIVPYFCAFPVFSVRDLLCSPVSYRDLKGWEGEGSIKDE